MQKFKDLGKSLSKAEQKKVIGGVMPMPPIKGLIGYRIDSNGNCWCDFCCAEADGGACCNQSCPVSMCNDGSMDHSGCSYNN